MTDLVAEKLAWLHGDARRHLPAGSGAEADGVGLGLDSQWFDTLDDAFISGMWDGPLPPGYEVG